MNVKPNQKQITSFLGALLVPLLSTPWAQAALNIEQSPLFTQDAIKPNLILSIDNSGSMDFSVSFDTNDGNLWWDSSAQSFASSGVLNFSTSVRYGYLFPNGTGTGERIFSNFYAVPPFAQYGFARSGDYNAMYYNPNVTYAIWPSSGSDTYSDITATAAPSDPATGTSTIDLTVNLEDTNTSYEFRVYSGMVIPNGTRYHDGSSWVDATSDITIPGGSVTNGEEIGVSYLPATYYIKKTSGTYTVNSNSGNCASPTSAHYSIFESNPSTLTGTDVDALSYDGACLTKVEVLAGGSYAHDGSRTDCASSSVCTYDEEIQNFANWYSYYRRRHLALRAGIGNAFTGLSDIRTGVFTIRNTPNITMRDMDNSTDSAAFFDEIYDIVGVSGGTPNRQALDHAGSQFMRTDANAPITASCQKNFTLLFTDGFTETFGTPPAGSDPTVTDQDNDEDPPYADTHSHTLGDIAMHYYKTNLRSDLTAGDVPLLTGCTADTPDPKLDCNSNLHMNTYTIGLGAKGTIFGVSHFEVADAFVSAPSWPDVGGDENSQNPEQIDDLYHAAVNGRGEIYNASSAADLQTQLKNAVVAIQAEQGSASAVTFNTATLESSSNVFLALFNSALWTGDIKAFSLDGVTGEVSSDKNWSAAEQLDDGTPSANNRVILTYNAASAAGASFRWDSLSATQKADLNAISVSGLTGSDALDYIRGDKTNESATKFRVRDSLLGDIISGSPVYVGKPSLGWPASLPFPTDSGKKYSDFVASQAAMSPPRTEIVYAGANDGMLHGFDADSGEELIAYIPNLVYSSSANEGLHYLTQTDYQHRFYVDQSPTVSDVYIKADPSDSEAAWRTVLVGGLQAGGKGIYALDITDPSTFSEANADDIVLWEFSHTDLGYTFSKPTIAMMENGRWAAIFGNGYNSTGEEAKLFIVFLDGGIDGVWTDGSGSTDEDYIVISTDGTTSNGMSTPRVLDTDGNGAADRVYAGDLQGNMWAFDISNTSSTSNWDVAYYGAGSEAGTKMPLFTAEDSSSNRQPITTKPAIVFHPTEATTGTNTPNLMIFFGTGKFLETTDITSTDSQTFYGIWDHGDGELDRSDLQSQTISTVTDTDNEEYRVLTDNTVNGSEDGWYIDLPAARERSVTDPAVRGDNVFFNTWIPSSAPCDAGGEGFLMSVAQVNGGEPDNPVFDTDEDGDVDTDDQVSNKNVSGQEFTNGLPASSRFLANKQYTPGTDSDTLDEEGGGVRDVEDLGGTSTGRLSWQEMVND